MRHAGWRGLLGAITGPLPPSISANVAIEARTTLAYGVFYAAGLAFLPVIMRRMGAGADMLALYITLTYVGELLAPLSLLALRRTTPLRLIVGCWVAARLVFIALAAATGPWALIAIVTVFYIIELFPAPAYARLIHEAYPLEVRGRAMSATRMVMVAAMIVVTPLAGVALDRIGPAVLLPLAAGIGVLGALNFAQFRVAAPSAPGAAGVPASPGMLAAIRDDRRFLVYLGGVTLFGFGGIIGTPLYPIVHVDRLQLSYTTIGTLTLVQSLCWLAGFVLWGRVIDRHGALTVVVIGALCSAGVPLVYLGAVDAWSLAPAFILQGLVYAGFDLGMKNAVFQLAGATRVAPYAAAQQLIIGARGLVAPLLSAGLIRLGVAEAVIFVTGALLLVAAALVFQHVRR
jgi:hypothetical protein